MDRIDHPFGPLFSGNSRVLILGSFPSVKSREQQFFYGHPQNRFWKVIAALYRQETPVTVEQKKDPVLYHECPPVPSPGRAQKQENHRSVHCGLYLPAV